MRIYMTGGVLVIKLRFLPYYVAKKLMFVQILLKYLYYFINFTILLFLSWKGNIIVIFRS